MVAEGKLPGVDRDDSDEAIAAVVQAMRTTPTEVKLMAEAAEFLLCAVNAKGNRQGMINTCMTNWGLTLVAGDRHDFISNGDRRAEAKYRHALDQLIDCGLVERETESLLWVTYSGYLVADEILVRQAKESTTV
jgi:hypothetical protein